jgi:hypothetical protein
VRPWARPSKLASAAVTTVEVTTHGGAEALPDCTCMGVACSNQARPRGPPDAGPEHRVGKTRVSPG